MSPPQQPERIYWAEAREVWAEQSGAQLRMRVSLLGSPGAQRWTLAMSRDDWPLIWSWLVGEEEAQKRAHWSNERSRDALLSSALTFAVALRPVFPEGGGPRWDARFVGSSEYERLWREGKVSRD